MKAVVAFMNAVGAFPDASIDYALTADAGVSLLLPIILGTGLLYRRVCHFVLHWRLGRLQYGGTSKWFFTRYLIGRDIRNYVGDPLFLKWSQGLIAIIAVEILLFSYARSLYRGAGEFARGGALVVIAGLTSILIGYLVSEKLRDRWAEIASDAPDDLMEVGLANLSSVPRDKVQLQANITAFAISLIGTFFWAYGDQALDCAIYPHLAWPHSVFALSKTERPDGVATCGMPPKAYKQNK